MIVTVTKLSGELGSKYRSLITVKYLKLYIFGKNKLKELWETEKYYSNSRNFNYLMRRGKTIARKRTNEGVRAKFRKKMY